MSGAGKVPLSVWAGLAIAIMLDTAVQISWKLVMLHVPADANVVQMVLYMVQQPLLWGVIAMFLTQLFNWIKVLGQADLSYAQPITSLSFVSVCMLSVLLLHEVITVKACAGIALILGGVFLISSGEHKTTEGGLVK